MKFKAEAESLTYTDSSPKERKRKDIYSQNRKIIIDYLNEKLGTKYKSDSSLTQKYLDARFNEGYSIEDCKKVIDIKFNDWFNDDKMKKYLRPETLFSNKFENYLNQAGGYQHNGSEQSDENVDIIIE